MGFHEQLGTRCRSFVAGAVMLAVQWSVQAQNVPGYPQDIFAYDQREIALLPPYCIHTQLFRERVPGGNNPAEIQRWRSVMGAATFESLHHYCWGLMKTHRGMYLARDEQSRRYYLADSIGEFDYVLRHANDDFILLPEILTKKGENLIRLDKAPLAMLELERAIELKPDYWPPYARIADYYKDRGDRGKAEEYLQRGLKHAPDAAALKRRLAELRGAKEPRKSRP